MLGFYIISGVLGAALIGLTLFFGDSDSDADVHLDGGGDADFSGDVGGDLDVGADAELAGDVHFGGGHGDVDHFDGHAGMGVWLPFLSVRFWTFFACFFGVVGTAMTVMGRSFALTLGLALSLGGVTGWLASYVMHRLSKEQLSSGVSVSDYIGLSAKVLVPVGAGREGQIRCFVKGTYVDLLAQCDASDPLPAKSEVLIIEMNGLAARVVPAPVGEGESVGQEASDDVALLEGHTEGAGPGSQGVTD